MEITLQPEAPPLSWDASGALRVGRSRVLVELVIHAFQDGATPEAIAQRYPTATLADIYAVIAYYLRHREDIEAYLDARSSKPRKCAKILSATREACQTCIIACAYAMRRTEAEACYGY